MAFVEAKRIVAEGAFEFGDSLWDVPNNPLVLNVRSDIGFSSRDLTEMSDLLETENINELSDGCETCGYGSTVNVTFDSEDHIRRIAEKMRGDQ